MSSSSEDVVNVFEKKIRLSLGYKISSLVALIFVTVVYLVIESVAEPFVRPFDPTDKDISHPHLPDIVSTFTLFAVSLSVPLVCFLLYYGYHFRFTNRDANVRLMDYFTVVIFESVLPFSFGFAINLLVTEFFKVTVGRLRPDFLARCQPPAVQGSSNSSSSSQIYLCNGDPSFVKEGRKSFISGHASISFYASTYLTCWVYATMGRKAFASASKSLWHFWIITILLGPFFYASYVAISRTQQYIHHPTDVLAGSLVGILIAIYSFIYFQYSLGVLHQK